MVERSRVGVAVIGLLVIVRITHAKPPGGEPACRRLWPLRVLDGARVGVPAGHAGTAAEVRTSRWTVTSSVSVVCSASCRDRWSRVSASRW